MEKKKELSLGSKIALIICSVLVLANLVVEIIEMINGTSIVMSIVGLLLMVAALYYAYFGYKKPHGNLLRNVFFIYPLLYAAFLIFTPQTPEKYITAIILLEVVLIAFMAGRLNKFKQNIAIIAIVGICSLVYGICYLGNTTQDAALIIRLFHAFSSFIGWATLSVAYISRYEAHTEAGLADK